MVAMRRGSEGGEQHGKLSRSMNRMTRVFLISHVGFQRRIIKHMRDAASPVLYSQESYLK